MSCTIEGLNELIEKLNVMDKNLTNRIAKNVIKDVLRDCEDRNIKEWAYLKNSIKDNLKEYLYQHIKQ